MNIAAQREIAASLWVAKLDGLELDVNSNPVEALAQIDTEFAIWVSESTLNRVEFLRGYAVWKATGRAVKLSSRLDVKLSQESHSIDPVEAPPTRSKAWPWSIAASILLCTSLLFYTNIRPIPEESYETKVGGLESVALKDGSKLHLNTNTTLEVDLSESKREVTLVKGEAFFNVAHDESRPFIVDVGGAKITVLGTQFSVHKTEDSIEVIVTEGKVKVETEESTNNDSPTILTKGNILLADKRNTKIKEIKKIEEQKIYAALEWRSGKLTFNDMVLTQVVEEFNRYNHTKLSIVGENPDRIRISGSFNSDNAEAFARLLKSGFELDYSKHNNKIVIKV